MAKILIIEDEEAYRDAVSQTLRGECHEMFCAQNGREGVELGLKIVPDLVLCDVNMPVLDGFETLKEFRRHPSTADIPFMFVTGIGYNSMREGMNLGADDFLVKPFTAEILLSAVQTRLRKRELAQRKSQNRLDELRASISLSLPHEFRTPLTGILGFAEILMEPQGLSQDESVYIGSHIHKSGKRLQQLLENMLLMAELNVEATDPARVKFLRSSSCSVGIALVQRVEAQALESGRKDDVRLSITDARVKVLEPHLSKAIEELVSNALKFSNKGTPVNVGTSIHKDRVAISIEDKGKGMSREQVQRLGAFVQFDRARNEQQGSGLGLALVKKICDLYGGSLSVESPNSVGTKVILKFPLAE